MAGSSDRARTASQDRAGPVALVTGCSSGMGRAIAVALASNGYRVAASARDPGTLEDLGSAVSLRLDVADDASVREAVDQVLQQFGRIDVLVNNAGYAIRGAVEELDMRDVARMFDVNVNGIIRMTRAVAPVMRHQGSGRIINIGSIGGKLAGPANGSYSATKYAVEGLSDSMRWELWPFGIDVILVEPGGLATNFARSAVERSSSLLARKDSPYA